MVYYCNDLGKYVSYGENSISFYSDVFINRDKCPQIEKESYITIVTSILDSICLEKSILKLDDFYTLSTFHFYFFLGENSISFYNHVNSSSGTPILLDEDEKEKLIKEVRHVIYR